MKRVKLKAVAAAVIISGVLIGGTGGAALAATVSLGPSEFDGQTKMYYSKERIKPSTGTATMKVTKETFVCETSCGGGALYTGMRNQSAPYDEDTNFPRSDANYPTGTVKYKNIRNNSYTFGAGSYWFNAQYQGEYDADSGDWWGTLTW